MPSNGPDALDQALAEYQATAPRLPQTGAKPLPQPSTGAPPPAPPVPPPAPKPKGILESIMDGLNNLGQGIGENLQGSMQTNRAQAEAAPQILSAAAVAPLRAPGQLIGGTLDTASDAGRFIDDNISGALLKLGGPKLAAAYPKLAPRPPGASLADTLSFRQSLGKVGDAGVNDFLTQAVASIIPTLAGKAGMLGTAAKVAFGAGVAADAQGVTPGGRLAERGEQAAVAGVSTLGIEAALPLVKALIASRGVRTLAEATPHEAAADALTRTYGTLNTQAEREAQAATEEGTANGNGISGGGSETVAGEGDASSQVGPPGPAGEGEGTPGTVSEKPPEHDAGGTQPPAEPEHPLAADANGLLEHAGAEERVVSGPPAPPASGKQLEAQAKELLGGTSDIKQAGFITSDGKLLNLSSDGDVRDMEHSNVSRIAGLDQGARPSDSLRSFLQQTGAIRFGQEGVAEVGAMPTPQAIRTLVRNIVSLDRPFTVEVTGAGTLEVDPAGIHGTRPTVDGLTKFFQEELSKGSEGAPPNPPAVSPDGRIIVSPESKAALEAKGTARGFTTLEESTSPSSGESPAGAPPKDDVIFKEEDDHGGSRVVGSMDRTDLEHFVEDARSAQANLSGPDDINTPADHESGQWNLHPLGNSDDAAAVGRALVDRLPKDERPVTDETLLMSARAMGFDHPNDAAILGGILSNSVEDLPQAIVAARLLSRKINDVLQGLTNTDWSTVPLGESRWEDALAAYHNGYSWMQMFRDAKSQVARALRANQIDLDGNTVIEDGKIVKGLAGRLGFKPVDAPPAQPVPDFDTYLRNFGKTPVDGLQAYPKGSMPGLPRTPQEFKDALDLLGMSHQLGPQYVNDFWKGVTISPGGWQTLRNSFANWYVASIVSRLSTFGRDLVGPAVLGGLRTIEKSTGATMQAIGNATLGDSSKVAGNFAAAGDAVHMYVRTWGDMVDALKGARVTLMSGHSQLGSAQPYDFSTKQIPWQMIQALSKGPLDTAGYVLGNAINLFPSAVHAMHGGVNEFALNLAYNGELRTQAMMFGRQNGLDGDALSDYVRDAVMAGRDPVSGQATDISALTQAQTTTFTKPVVDENSNSATVWAMKTLNGLQTEVPIVGRMVVPILKVPANGLGEQLRRVPILNLAFKETQQALSGMHGDIAQAEAMGRMVTGGTMLGGGLLLANRGLLTGAGPANPKDRSDWEAAGFQPYSIKLPDGRWYKYNKIDVVGAMLGVMAQMHDMTVYHSTEEDTLWKQTLGATSAIAEYIKDQAALKTLSDVMSFGGNPSADAGHLQSVFNGMASGMVPGFLQAVRDRIDPDKRTVRSMGDAVQNAIPFASKTLDPVRNLFGQPVHVPIGEALLPVTTSEVNPNGPQSDVLNEIHRLFVASGSVPGPLSPSLPGGRKDMRDITLEDGRSLYDARMRARSIVRDDNGATIEEALRAVIQSEDYKDGYDGTVHGEESAPDGRLNRAALLNHVFQDFDTRATQAVAQYSDIGATYMAIGRMKRLNPPGASLHTTDQFAHNPALLSALGIDIESYKETLRGQ